MYQAVDIHMHKFILTEKLQKTALVADSVRLQVRPHLDDVPQLHGLGHISAALLEQADEVLRCGIEGQLLHDQGDLSGLGRLDGGPEQAILI